MSYGPNYRRAMSISEYIDTKVAIICTDGCYFVGILDGFDRFTNLILKNTQERVIGPQGTQIKQLGTFIIRGELVAVIGPVEEDLDDAIDWSNVNGDQIKSTRIPY